MEFQTDGFIVLGVLPNEERYHCLVCRSIPDVVRVELFTPEPTDIPASVVLPKSRTLVMPYRLCQQCYETKPSEWKIRLLMLERLNALAELDRR